MDGTTARAAHTCAIRFTSTMRRQALTGWPRSPGAGSVKPAFEQKTSIGPNESSAVLTSPSIASGSETSQPTPRLRSPIRSATFLAHSVLMSATTTPRAPSAANRSASARPIPLAPPVTTATWPASFMLVPPPSRRRGWHRPRVAAPEIVTARIAPAAELLIQRGVVLHAAGAGQRVEELHRLGLLVRGDVPPAVLDEVPGCRGGG